MASHGKTKKPLDQLKGSVRVQLFRLRACFHGILYFTCPWCGNKNESRLNPLSWKVSCSGTGCGGNFIPSIGLRPTIQGAANRPADYNVPAGDQLLESMPLGEFVRDPWQSGMRVHKVYDAERLKEIDVLERFFARAGFRLDPSVLPPRSGNQLPTTLDYIIGELNNMYAAVGLTRPAPGSTVPPVTTGEPKNSTNVATNGKKEK